MRVAFVHYHLKRGGVTSVIATAAKALGREHTLCALAAGTAPEDFACPFAPVPALDYSDAPPHPDAAKLAHTLATAARSVLGALPDVWHVHNHALGKNPALTAAIPILAAQRPVLLQIHDFAEDGRPANYARLRKALPTLPLFPDAPQIHYALLNQRDLRILIAAGIPPERCHWLPNAVDTRQAAPPCAPNTPAFDALYPTRAIRRKNLGEALLLAALLPDARFAATLAPQNPSARPIYDDWVAFAHQQAIPFAFEVGTRFDFPSLIHNARSLLTTAINEGFGMAFLEPALADKPLIGRDLPEITSDFKANGLQLPALYPHMAIPADWVDTRALHAAFFAALTERYALFDVPMPTDAVERALQAAKPEPDTFDFGRLTEPLQRAVICAARANPGTLRAPALTASCPSATANRAVLEAHYAVPAYAARLRAIYHSLQSANFHPPTFFDAAPVLHAFLQPERFNPLAG